MPTLQRLLFEHRRLVAAVLAGLAVLAALSSLKPDHAGEPTLVAARDLVSGTVISADDVRTVDLPPAVAPSHGFTDPDHVLGRRVAGPMRSGEALTDFRILEPGPLDGHPDGTVLSTVRIADPDGLAGVRVGDRLDIVAVDPTGEAEPEVVARQVELVTLPEAAADSGGLPIGIITTEETALRLATLNLRSRFSALAS